MPCRAAILLLVAALAASVALGARADEPDAAAAPAAGVWNIAAPVASAAPGDDALFGGAGQEGLGAFHAETADSLTARR